MNADATPGKPGLLVLHGNRLEALAEGLLAWLQRHPLGPLEVETVLVPSNGMAEWFKMTQAAAHGVSAAARVELPARFLWRACRTVLGRAAVPTTLPLDKLPLTWRLMSLLPALAAARDPDPALAPLAAWLDDGGPARRLQLAQRIADQFDQYQVFRSDWLDGWARGRDGLAPMPDSAPSLAIGLPQDQRWQPVLWRRLLDALPPAHRSCTRAALQRRLAQALQADPAQPGAPPRWPQLPRRVVLFGTTQLPLQILEVLAALSRHAQIIVAVPNPCRYHWADIIDGRERLAFERHRQPLRNNRPLDEQPLQAMHAFGHPLLAAWGRQARDFVRQLDAFDDTQRSLRQFDMPRVDLFDEADGDTLLQQVQARIRDLVPLAEHREQRPPANDRSIVFHLAHSAQREVEILHDQLLHLLAHPPGGEALHPRDIVVMVPDVERFAPAIQAVFGRAARGDARHIPWGIADLRLRGHLPLAKALEWLLRADEHRFTVSEFRDLLDVPALARRFGLGPETLPQAIEWIGQAGIRWGLDGEHRAALGLAACGDVNTWRFGLRRMLLGYAAGDLSDGFNGIEPLAEVAGLSAGAAGALAELVETLARWWADARLARNPLAWGERARALLQEAFAAVDDEERGLLAQADDALTQWLDACEAAGFDEPVELGVLREAWLGGLQEPGQSRRFKAGGVTFCTLLPLRAIPFEVVCLLGMNDGDYPRAAPASDFDLMALPGLARPGDRSRRDDDRQLMLDAVLAARRVLYISSVGLSQRDNTALPPSALVAQLRDYIDAAWGEGVCDERSLQHPLQPFSRRYFEAPPAPDGRGLFTYAREWHAAHDGEAAAAGSPAAPARAAVPEVPVRLGLADLAAFLRNPVRAFFRRRLKVVFDGELGPHSLDAESFAAEGLEHYGLLREILSGMPETDAQHSLRRLARAGLLPLAGPGEAAASRLAQTLNPMLAEWQRLRTQHPLAAPPLRIRVDAADDVPCVLDDTVDTLWSDAAPDSAIGVEWSASALFSGGRSGKAGHRRDDKLLAAWVRALACAAAGRPLPWVVIGTDAVCTFAPLDAVQARPMLQALLATVGRSLLEGRPLASAPRTGLAWLDEQVPAGDAGADRVRPSRGAAERSKAAQAYEGDGRYARGEGEEPCLQRLYPDFESLSADPRFASDTHALYAACRHSLLEGLSSTVWAQAVAEAQDDG